MTIFNTNVFQTIIILKWHLSIPWVLVDLIVSAMSPQRAITLK